MLMPVEARDLTASVVGVTDGCELPDTRSGPNSGSLQGQSVIGSAEQSLQPS